MSILNELRNEKSWNNFFQYKIDHSLLTPGEEKYFRNYIEHKKYLPIANEIKIVAIVIIVSIIIHLFLI